MRRHRVRVSPKVARPPQPPSCKTGPPCMLYRLVMHRGRFRSLRFPTTFQGKFDEADELFLRAVEIHEEDLGSGHAGLAAVLKMRASSFMDQVRIVRGFTRPLVSAVASRIWSVTNRPCVFNSPPGTTFPRVGRRSLTTGRTNFLKGSQVRFC